MLAVVSHQPERDCWRKGHWPLLEGGSEVHAEAVAAMYSATDKNTLEEEKGVPKPMNIMTPWLRNFSDEC